MVLRLLQRAFIFCQIIQTFYWSVLGVFKREFLDKLIAKSPVVNRLKFELPWNSTKNATDHFDWSNRVADKLQTFMVSCDLGVLCDQALSVAFKFNDLSAHQRRCTWMLMNANKTTYRVLRRFACCRWHNYTDWYFFEVDKEDIAQTSWRGSCKRAMAKGGRTCCGRLWSFMPWLSIRRRWGTPTDASSVMTAHQPRSSAMHSNEDTDCPVHSPMLSCLRRLPPTTVPCSMIFVSVSRRQTWPNHDNLWRLTVKAPVVRRGYCPVAIHNRLYYALCTIWQASFCSIWLKKPRFASPDPQSASSLLSHP